MIRRAKENKKFKFSFNLKFKAISAVLIAFLSFYVLKYYNESESFVAEKSEPVSQVDHVKNTSSKVLRYWGVSVRKWNPNGSLRTMNRVLRKLGYKFVNASNGDQWDILWSIEYPFKSTIRQKTRLFDPMENFTPRIEQRVNHFPGIQYITNKGILGSFTQSKYLLSIFIFPDDEEKFVEYSKSNPDVKFVEKLYTNRGVRIVTIDEFDKKDVDKIYQVFMDKPFLIDGHAFDFGVYVVISSINPLRIYRYDHEVFIRFCPEKYHPFDPSIRLKYVVDDDHMSVYDVPIFREIYGQYGYTFKIIFENLIKNAGFDVRKFWARVDDAITDIIMKNEKHLINHLLEEGLNTTINFFELIRFDMILDEELNPYVIEVNMSPNLTPAEDRFEENSLIYEPLLYKTLKLVGAGSFDDFMSRVSDEKISANFKNLATNMEICTKNNCIVNCDDPSCLVCLTCIDEHFFFHLREAYREHVRKEEFKRVFPASAHFHDKNLFETLNENNQIMLKWFEAKCENDQNWC